MCLRSSSSEPIKEIRRGRSEKVIRMAAPLFDCSRVMCSIMERYAVIFNSSCSWCTIGSTVSIKENVDLSIISLL